MKTCKTCRWVKDWDCLGMGGTFAECGAPKAVGRGKMKAAQAVGDTGHVRPRFKFCEIQREDGFIWARLLPTCGLEGRWWEPKP